KTRLVLDMDRRAEFRVFMLPDPVRIAIDLPAGGWGAGAVAKPPGSLVRDIRQGPLQPGTGRIVIDLSGPAVLKSVFFLPRDGRLPDRLVIDFSRSTEADFQAQRNRVFGSLKVGEGV